MGSGQRVSLPSHLWAAVDEMARDGAVQADALLASAVEQFVALQGYLVPAGAAGASAQVKPVVQPEPTPSGPIPEVDDEGLARTVARAAVSSKELRAVRAGAAEPTAPEPPRAPLTGLGPTHVPVKAKAEAPGPTTTSGTSRERAAPAPPVPLPDWVKPVPRRDDEEERSAARERIAAVYAEVDRLTLERPTTTPLRPRADGDDG